MFDANAEFVCEQDLGVWFAIESLYQEFGQMWLFYEKSVFISHNDVILQHEPHCDVTSRRFLLVAHRATLLV